MSISDREDERESLWSRMHLGSEHEHENELDDENSDQQLPDPSDDHDMEGAEDDNEQNRVPDWAWEEQRSSRAKECGSESVLSLLQERELGEDEWGTYSASRRLCRRVCNRLPEALHETFFRESRFFNKMFAQTWLDGTHFLTGSKDNYLTLWDVADVESPRFRLLSLPPPMGEFNGHGAGIHDMSVSPDKSLIATGSGSPNELAVLRNDGEFGSSYVCVGHRDWVFGCDWVDDNVFWSCARDRQILVWRVPDDARTAQKTFHGSGSQAMLRDDGTFSRLTAPSPMNPAQITRLQPVAAHVGHWDRIRAMKYNRNCRLMATLGADKLVKFWDVERQEVTRQVATHDQDDLICLDTDLDRNLFAVGGRDYVSLVDPRVERIIKDIRSPDESMGVRSVTFHHDFLSMGGGKGRLAFADLRKLPPQHYFWRRSPGGTVMKWYVTVGPGVVTSEPPAWHEPQAPAQAVYVHHWNPDGSRLFVGGGPLMLGINGCYCSVW